MEKYIVKTELPDAKIGTEVLWDEVAEAYYYVSDSICPTQKHYLSIDQVKCGEKYFCKAVEYPEYYAFHYPVFSRSEILKILNEIYSERISSTTREIYNFQVSLRKLGLEKAHKVLDKK